MADKIEEALAVLCHFVDAVAATHTADPPPDLQALVRRHGGYDEIPPEAWAE